MWGSMSSKSLRYKLFGISFTDFYSLARSKGRISPMYSLRSPTSNLTIRSLSASSVLTISMIALGSVLIVAIMLRQKCLLTINKGLMFRKCTVYHGTRGEQNNRLLNQAEQYWALFVPLPSVGFCKQAVFYDC
jgi:hypothetical protein